MALIINVYFCMCALSAVSARRLRSRPLHRKAAVPEVTTRHDPQVGLERSDTVARVVERSVRPSTAAPTFGSTLKYASNDRVKFPLRVERWVRLVGHGRTLGSTLMYGSHARFESRALRDKKVRRLERLVRLQLRLERAVRL